MRRFCALFIAFAVLCTSVFAYTAPFKVVEDLGDGTSVITFDDYDYYVVSNDDIAKGDISPTVSIAWTPRDEKKEELKNEVVNTPPPAVPDVDNVSPAEDINNPVLAEAFANGDSVYVLSGDMPYVESSGAPADDMQYVGTQLLSLSPVTPSNTSGFKAVLVGLLGNYDTIVTVHQYQSDTSSYRSYVTDVQPDFVWLTGAALLLLLIYCLFRLGGALIHG